MAATIAEARFIYLAGGSPLHLRAVLKKSAVFDGLKEALPPAPSWPEQARAPWS